MVKTNPTTPSQKSVVLWEPRLAIVKTAIGWSRDGIRLYWLWRFRRGGTAEDY
jgi:hypothetical protein